MKNALLRIGKELLRGKNIQTYLLIVAAILMPIGKWRGIISNEWMLTVTIAMLGILAFNTIANGWLLEDLKLHKNSNEIVVLSSWSSNHLTEKIHSAKKSIVMIQSWFAEAATLADHINSAAKNRTDKNKLSVKIFMLDPELTFGAQRHAEVNGALPSYDFEYQKEKYREEFEISKRRFISRLQRSPGVDLQVFTYPTLPTLVCYIIDDKEFIFGWLGADGPSTQNVGFHLSSGSNDAGVELVTEKIRNHYDAIEKHSKQVWPSA